MPFLADFVMPHCGDHQRASIPQRMAKSDLASLTANPRNPRKITKKKLAMLRTSMAYYGDLSGIVQVEGGDLIGGHQRIDAYRDDPDATLEITATYDPPRDDGTTAEGYVTAAGSRFAYRRTNWNSDKAHGAALAANKGAGEWDLPLVSEMMGELDASGFDLDLTLFDAQERNSLLAEDVPEEEPEDDEGRDEVVIAERAKPGDIFWLGKHRMMCGDSTNPQHVAALMQDKKADLVFTSPPYMQQRDYGKVVVDWRQLMHDVFSLLPTKEDGQVLVNLGLIHIKEEWQPYWDLWIADMREMGWRRYAFYVWSKTDVMPGASHGRLALGWEPIFHFNKAAKPAHKTKNCDYAGKAHSGEGTKRKDGTTKNWHSNQPVQDKKIPSAVIEAPTAKGSQWSHPAKFSRELCKEIIEPYSNRGELMYEPFAGAGTMLIASEQTGRICYAMELEPKYCDIILARWESETGDVAVLESQDE